MVLSVKEAEAVRTFTTYLSTNENFKDSIVTGINNSIDIPLLLEQHEKIIFESIYDIVVGALANASDNIYGSAVAEEREAQRQLEESSSDPQ